MRQASNDVHNEMNDTKGVNMYDNACYSQGMTFLFQFGKSTDFPNLNLACPLTFLIQFGKSTNLTFHKSCC